MAAVSRAKPTAIAVDQGLSNKKTIATFQRKVPTKSHSLTNKVNPKTKEPNKVDHTESEDGKRNLSFAALGRRGTAPRSPENVTLKPFKKTRSDVYDISSGRIHAFFLLDFRTRGKAHESSKI